MFLTDMAEMESLMQHNITLNGLEDRAKARILNWLVLARGSETCQHVSGPPIG